MPPTLSDARLTALLAPYLDADLGPDTAAVPTAPLAALLPKLQSYLDLLLRWNARTNLTSIREPERIVQRHFGESLFAARVVARLLGPHTPALAEPTILDFGSGAGFPGIPIQLLLPSTHVALAESQSKKAAFLREAVRSLDLPAQVWAARVEAMPPAQTFAAVTMRAVDRHQEMLPAAAARLRPEGVLLELAATEAEPSQKDATLHLLASYKLPGEQSGALRTYRRHTS